MKEKSELVNAALRERYTDKVRLVLALGGRINKRRVQMPFPNESKRAEHIPRKET